MRQLLLFGERGCRDRCLYRLDEAGVDLAADGVALRFRKIGEGFMPEFVDSDQRLHDRQDSTFAGGVLRGELVSCTNNLPFMMW